MKYRLALFILCVLIAGYEYGMLSERHRWHKYIEAITGEIYEEGFNNGQSYEKILQTWRDGNSI